MERALAESLVAKWSPVLESAFVNSVRQIRSSVVLGEVESSIAAGDVVGALEALHTDASAFSSLVVAAEQAYTAAGTEEVASLPRVRDLSGRTVVMRFAARDPSAVNWLQSHSSSMIGGIVGEQQANIRAALTDAYRQGWPALRTARSIVGRYDYTAGRRIGGLIGMSTQHTGWVNNARRELLSGNEAALRNYLTRGRRNRRFDPLVRSALERGRGLSVEDTEKIVGRYADRLLMLRGTNIANMETRTAVARGRNDSVVQQIVAGKISASDVDKTWRTRGDNHVRRTHRFLNGKTVAFGEDFRSPSGEYLAYPMDPDASMAERSGCRCHAEYSVSGAGAVGVRPNDTRRVLADA